MSLSKLQDLMMDREAWRAAVHASGPKELDTTEHLNCATWEAPILHLTVAKRLRTKGVNVQVKVWERYLKYMCLVHIKNYKSGRKI